MQSLRLKMSLMACLLALLALLAPVSVLAQQESTTTTAFDAWVLNCVTRTDGKATGKDAAALKGCEVRSTVTIKDEKTNQQGVAALIAVGRVGGLDKPLQVAVQVPLAAQLNVPVRLLNADDKPIADLSYVACQPNGCMAGAPLNEAQLSALGMSTDKLFVTYANQLGQALKVEVSAKGLGAALRAMSKEQQ